MYWEVKVGPTLPPVLESRTGELLNGPAKKKCLSVQRGYSVLTVPPLGFEGLSETLIMFNYL